MSEEPRESDAAVTVAPQALPLPCDESVVITAKQDDSPDNQTEGGRNEEWRPKPLQLVHKNTAFICLKTQTETIPQFDYFISLFFSKT